MKTITINVSEPVYESFRRAAQRSDRPTSELIREAMEVYGRERLRRSGDLRDFQPLFLGQVLKVLHRDDDLQTEMLDVQS